MLLLLWVCLGDFDVVAAMRVWWVRRLGGLVFGGLAW